MNKDKEESKKLELSTENLTPFLLAFVQFNDNLVGIRHILKSILEEFRTLNGK